MIRIMATNHLKSYHLIIRLRPPQISLVTDAGGFFCNDVTLLHRLLNRGMSKQKLLYRNNSFAFSTEQAFFIAAAAIEVMRLLTFLA